MFLAWSTSPTLLYDGVSHLCLVSSGAGEGSRQGARAPSVPRGECGRVGNGALAIVGVEVVSVDAFYHGPQLYCGRSLNRRIPLSGAGREPIGLRLPQSGPVGGVGEVRGQTWEGALLL